MNAREGLLAALAAEGPATAAALPQAVAPSAFRQAMRRLAGGVCVVTAEHGGRRTGFTATSVVSVGVDPPELLVSVSEAASSWPVIQASRRLGINVLDARHREVAERFSGAGGVQGEQRYEAGLWRRDPAGAWLLADAPAAFACEVQEVWLRRGHALVIGRVVSLAGSPAPGARPLVYWQGSYGLDRDQPAATS